MRNRIFLALILSFLCVTANAAEIPTPLGTDQRIRQVMYSPDQVFEISSVMGFQTAIEFSPQETIQVASLGDSIAWQVVPSGSKLFFKPVTNDAATNMTVVTNLRTYYFNLTTLKSEDASNMTYLIRFNYPEAPPIYSGLSTGPKNPTDLNFDYKIKQEKNGSLIRVFDDGEFTYLQFKNLSDLPAILLVDAEGKESLANYRIKEPYVVIERVGSQFVLRSGKTTTRVINNFFPSANAVRT